MKREQLIILLAVCVAGVFTGHAGKHLLAGGASHAEDDSPASRSHEAQIGKEGGAAALASFDRDSRSLDTVESLLALDEQDLLPRLALWLSDAGEDEIASFWQHYREKTPLQPEISTLIFASWARFDPQGLVDRLRGGKEEALAWTGWSVIDPDAALRAVLQQNPSLANMVVEIIGGTHAKWLRDHIDQVPPESRVFALQALEGESGQADPGGALDFLIEHGRGFQPEVFKSLARRDPWAAYDWLRENDNVYAMIYGSGMETPASEVLARMLLEEDVGTLEKIALHAPPGKLKRTLEAALFQHQLDTDPKAALESAVSIKAPFVAAERLALAGKKFTASDPEASFRIAAQLFEKSPLVLSALYLNVEVGNTSTSWATQNTEVSQFVETLYQLDPGRLLSMESFQPKGSSHGGNSFGQIANQWSNDDPQGYLSWLDSQTNPEIFDNGSKILIQKQLHSKNYADAADRALMLATGKEDHLRDVIYYWGQSNKDEARAWLDGAGLPEPEARTLKASLNSQ